MLESIKKKIDHAILLQHADACDIKSCSIAFRVIEPLNINSNNEYKPVGKCSIYDDNKLVWE